MALNLRPATAAGNERMFSVVFILKGEKCQLTILCRDYIYCLLNEYIYLLFLRLFVVIIFFLFSSHQHASVSILTWFFLPLSFFLFHLQVIETTSE